ENLLPNLKSVLVHASETILLDPIVDLTNWNWRFRPMKTKIICSGAILSVTLILTMLAAAGGKMKISSAAFQEGGNIPPKFSYDGGNASPALQISGAPENAKSLVLIVDD